MINLQINNLYTTLENDINNSGLPVGMVYFIVKTVLQEIEPLYTQVLEMESHPVEEVHDISEDKEESSGQE